MKMTLIGLDFAEAALRPNLHPVPVKSVAQQDLGRLVQLRDHLVRERTAKANPIRGFAREYGLVFPKGIRGLRLWLEALRTRRGHNRAIVALADHAPGLPRPALRGSLRHAQGLRRRDLIASTPSLHKEPTENPFALA
jgi:transposase